MTKRHVQQVLMFGRVIGFWEIHRNDFPEGSEGQKAFETVREALVRIKASADSRASKKKEWKGAKAVARATVVAQMKQMARLARVMAKSSPGADDRFQLPDKESDVAILVSARAFLGDLPPVKDGFIRCGLSASFVEDFQKATAVYEAAVTGIHDGRVDASGAKAAVKTAVAQGVDAVQSLDAIVGVVLGHDAEKLARWKRARRVDGAAKSSVTTSDVPADTLEPTTDATPAESTTLPKAS